MMFTEYYHDHNILDDSEYKKLILFINMVYGE